MLDLDMTSTVAELANVLTVPEVILVRFAFYLVSNTG